MLNVELPHCLIQSVSLFCLYINKLILHLTYLDHTKCFLFTETLPAGHYPYLKTQGVRDKGRQLLNFCSSLFITPQAKIISFYMLCLILHCCTVHRVLRRFPLLILSILIVLFCFIVHPSFVFYPIHRTVPGSS